MYNIGRQNEHRTTAKASMFIKTQAVAEAFLVRIWRQKGCQEEHTSGNYGPKEAADVKGAALNRRNWIIIVTVLSRRSTIVRH